MSDDEVWLTVTAYAAMLLEKIRGELRRR
jgi:hypothetical protein